MAYSLNDAYRYLRVVMRVDGIIVGLGLGVLFAFFSRVALANWGVYTAGPVWPIRLAGGLLLTFGVLLLFAAQDRHMPASILLAMTLGNGIVALTLLVGYLQGEWIYLNLFGRLLLVVVFVVCLAGALFPLQYLRAEYQEH